jgi:hypothetical protein
VPSESFDWQPPDFPRVEEALSADARVVNESGRWIVYLDVVLASGAARNKVGEYHDERRALQAARIIERNARRCITVPQGPSQLPGPPPFPPAPHHRSQDEGLT